MDRTFPSPYLATVNANPDKFQAGVSILFEPYNVGKQVTDVISLVRFVGYEGDNPEDATLEIVTLSHHIITVLGVSHFTIIYKDGRPPKIMSNNAETTPADAIPSELDADTVRELKAEALAIWKNSDERNVMRALCNAHNEANNFTDSIDSSSNL